MPTYPESKWKQLGLRMMEASGASKEEAETIVDVLVAGSLRGIDSHGVRILPTFSVKRKKADMKILSETPTTAILDADHTYGPVSAKKAMEIAIEKAATQNVGCCGVVNGEWITNLFYYSMLAANNDMIGTSVTRGIPMCAPWGGTGPVTGSNPISIAVPAGKSYPIVLDFATTIVSAGHFETLLLEGKPIPEGWLIDRYGKPVSGQNITYDEFWKEGGALLPFGTYKGYGLNLIVEIIAGALNPSGTGSRSADQGCLMTALNISAFVPVKDFKEEVDRLLDDVKSSPARPGFGGVLLPGEREHIMMEKRMKEGIPVDETSWLNILEACKKLGVDAKKIMQ